MQVRTLDAARLGRPDDTLDWMRVLV